MTTMIDDAVAQLKASIVRKKAASRHRYGLGEVVAVRYRTVVNGRELTTWRTARVASLVELRDTWLYGVVRVEGHKRVYTAVTESNVSKL